MFVFGLEPTEVEKKCSSSVIKGGGAMVTAIKPRLTSCTIFRISSNEVCGHFSMVDTLVAIGANKR